METRQASTAAPREYLATRIRKSIANVAVSITEQPTHEPGLAVNLSPRGFAISWAIILFFHLFNAAYTLGLAYIYVYLRRPSMDYYVSLIQIMPQWTYKYITVLYGTISVLNFKHVFTMVAYSIYYRQLVFKKRSVRVASMRTMSFKRRRWCICLPRKITRFLSRLKRALSVRGHLFDVKLILRELTEVASQTYQAHSSSLLVSSVWTNQLFGLIVFLNCVANTAVHIFKEDEVGMRRFLCTVVDLFLDFVWGFIFPGVIIFHYLPMFISNGYTLPHAYLSSDVLTIQTILDCRQFFIISWTDAFTTLLPYLGILTGLDNMKCLLEIRGSDADQAKLMATRAVAPFVDPHISNATISHDQTGPGRSNIPETLQPQEKSLFQRTRYMLLIPLFGLGVLLTSITASGAFGLGNCDSGCKLRMRPWFTTKCACSVLEIDCYDHKIEGNAEELRVIFKELDDLVLNSLILSHCPAVTMPIEFQRFHALNGLEFYNVTFVDWSREAAMDATSLPTLKYLYIARSHVGAWPEGLIHDTTPSLADVEISASVIDPMPDDLDQRWPHVVMFYFDFCGLQEFPMVLTRMALTDVSLVGNNIAMLPEDLREVTWMYVYLDRNPLQRIPDSVASIPQLTSFSIQDTSIPSLPQWLYDLHDTNPQLRIFAYSSGVCAEPHEDKEPFIYCSMNTNTINGGFPLLEKDAVRLISTASATPAYPVFYID